MKIATEHCSSISKAMAREEFSVKMYTNSVKQNIKPSIGVSTALPTHPYSNKIAARDQHVFWVFPTNASCRQDCTRLIEISLH